MVDALKDICRLFNLDTMLRDFPSGQLVTLAGLQILQVYGKGYIIN